MNLFEYAKKMEKDGEKFYRDLAEASGEKGIKRILTDLADAEVLHYNTLSDMEKKQATKLPDSKILANAKNVFSEMKLETTDPNFAFPQIDLFRQALEIEKKSRLFYEQKAAELAEPAERALFLQIAKEEEQHIFLVDNMIEFMERPRRWLEYAEWNHLDEY